MGQPPPLNSGVRVSSASPGRSPPRGRPPFFFRRAPARFWAQEGNAPIRDELFSIERLERQAQDLAGSERITRKPSRGRDLLLRVEDNGRVLTRAFEAITRAVAEERPITPAAEWLLDNFHVIEDHLTDIRASLPPSFYRELPKLTTERLRGFPRVYGLAWTYVAHTDSRVDPSWLTRYLSAYQRVEPLYIGEVWAFAISLRIVLIENLRRLAERITAGRDDRRRADELADRLLGPRENPPDPRALLASLENERLTQAFCVGLLQRLRDQDSSLGPVLRWLEDRLAEQDTTAEALIRQEHQTQTAMNATVRNVITSMRLLSVLDWSEFFEKVSAVDGLLRAEPGFGRMDFATRDLYRHAIESLSRASGLSEVEVTRRAMSLARQADPALPSVERARRADPGYYLVSAGRPAFEKSLGAVVPVRRRLLRFYAAHAAAGYIGAVLAAAAAVWFWPVASALAEGESGWLNAAMAALALLPASDLSSALVNLGVTKSIGPETIPKLDFSKGIPEEEPTLVVMPTLISSAGAVEHVVSQMEIHYLGNAGGRIQFALLTDWVDSPRQTAPEDDALLAAATAGVAALNERHGPGPGGLPLFLLLHRRRVWNPAEGVWMGWERKRGKLHELNRRLRGDAETTFMENAGETALMPGVRLVVTLDTDTRVGRGAIQRLAGAMAHPLNRPAFDEKARRVTAGYGVMQPRITPALPSLGAGSIHQRIFSGPAGIDAYAFAVSDVYQDLFGEGSYIGKGIYDVDAFEAAMKGRVPENALLSHDLYEGLFARAALVTDVEFFEEFPARYEENAARQHRWIRGDWQLLPFLFRDRMPASGRWKILDNMRRSLSPIAGFLLLGAAWWTGAPWIWSGIALAGIAVPALLSTVLDILPQRRRISWAHHFRGWGEELNKGLARILLSVVLLAHQAWLSADAIVRTFYRIVVSRRRMLQWVSSDQMRFFFEGRARLSASGLFAAPLLAAAATVILWSAPRAFAVEAFVLYSLWALSPWIARLVSAPGPTRAQEPLVPEDRRFLRLVARKTWRFFETFVNAESQHLPPDNFQEVPKPVVATRTSPTNIGLYLLSAVAARDFGWSGLSDTVERLEATMSTVGRLKTHGGHLFNWYDTKDLRPLDPPYISTVDSGNLAGHLLALSVSCRDLIAAPLLRSEIWKGLDDTVTHIAAAGAGVAADFRTGTVTGAQWREALNALRAAAARAPAGPGEWRARLADVGEKAETLADIARLLGTAGESGPDSVQWCEALLRQIRAHRADLDGLVPWEALNGAAEAGLTLAGVPDLCDEALAERASGDDVGRRRLEGVRDQAARLERRLVALARRAAAAAEAMDFAFLFDPVKKIFSIGYQVTEERLDPACYDLLASEARLGSFVAIAKGDAPTSHWFHMGRSFSTVEGGLALLSWSGSMFEYLMPLLVMREPAGSLLSQTMRLVVRRQIAYAAERRVPWGISESGYNARDMEMTYQYSNFGVPGLGLKRGLSRDLLIAPYATALAAMVDPAAAARNLRRLVELGADGRYGFYEALDFTASRLQKNEPFAVVREHMAHHQGMTLLSLLNVLHGGVMVRRFHRDPRVQATELLLQERMPRDAGAARISGLAGAVQAKVQDTAPAVSRRFHSPHDTPPRTHLLSNGRYSVMVNAAGSGYSRWRDMEVTRWRDDPTRDARGTYFFLRNAETGEVWSAAHQPRGVEPESYEVDFADDRAQFLRRDGALVTGLDILVSPEDDAEIRRVTIKNTGGQSRLIEVTSYAEIVLATPAADQAHPAFSNLFVQTEFVSAVQGLLCSRRPRGAEDPAPWAAHVLAVEGEVEGPLEYESDRMRFLGRGRQVRTPMSVIDGKPLTGTAGAVLDPIVSLRRRVRVGPGETARLSFTTLVAPTREKALALADKYRNPAMFDRTLTLAWTQAQMERHYLGAESKDIQLFQELAARLLYPHAGMRASQETLRRNGRGPDGLWAHGVSGDLPILLVRIDEIEDRDIVRQLLRAHEYWRMKNLAADLVILNEKAGSYQQELQDILENLVSTSQAALRHGAQAPGGRVFLLRSDRLSLEERTVLLTAARVILLSRHGSVAEQLERQESAAPPPAAVPRMAVPPQASGAAAAPPEKLEFFNGLGGFADDGKEYRVVLGTGQWTPAPWINVVANPRLGFTASEAGAGYTWAGNSRENKLTPWSNDPVCDTPGEVFYVRDEDTGELWTPTALPIREEAWPYVAVHGQGFSRFEHESHGIHLNLLQLVPPADPVKVSRLTLTNKSGRSRRLSVTAYVEWVLGPTPSLFAPHVVTERDDKTGAILARNAWNAEFAPGVAFASLSGKTAGWTGDRTEFLGRNGGLDHPALLERRERFSGKVGAGLDPCAALQTMVEIPAGSSAQVVFLLGQGADRAEAASLIARYHAANAGALYDQTRQRWDAVLGAVQIRTPNRAMDLMMNRWLLYQVLSCRLWGRSAFYQAGGAYGFRDQLQDVLALLVTRRDIAREQILRCAARQFPEGDVQHWWHPPSGRGVRTRISDDLLWLPYAVVQYTEGTGDFAILEETTPFLSEPSVPAGKDDAYYTPGTGEEKATLFEHCARALDRSLAAGVHGLPLIGAGDWNDGMNRVGHEGKGESVWLAWFLHSVLWEFAKLAEGRGESARAQAWRLRVGDLKAAVERAGWDGEWYKRAFFDDGTPMGAAENAECRIDSISQSWGVISGAADPARAAAAMASVDRWLVRRDPGLIRLFTPPFDKSAPSPGYIQGYLQGVRENGGQYTHAAAWVVMAFAALGQGDRAGEFFHLLNPIRHGSTRASIHRYKGEPYVMAADVYSEAPHVGRAGWTWYTGSASWMYRAGLESILGFRLRGTTLFLDPCIPRDWPSFEISFRYHSSRYEIRVENPQGVSRGVASVAFDGHPIRGDAAIRLLDDGRAHEIRMILGN